MGPTREAAEWQFNMKRRIRCVNSITCQYMTLIMLIFIYSALEYLEETKKRSAKVVALTGETLLAGTKAEKILGADLTAVEKVKIRKSMIEGKRI